MTLTRREFLLAGLSALTFAILGKSLKGVTHERSETELELIPPSPDTLLLRLVAVADTGAGNEGQYAIGRAIARYHEQNPFDLVMLAGDNIYNHGEIEKIGRVFEQPYRSLLDAQVKFYACLGNHDIKTNNGNDQVQYPGFNMQGRYYSLHRGPVQFFILDTNRNADWPNQLPWLTTQLQQSDAPWKIVVGHHPLYTSGLHLGSRFLRRKLMPLFQQHGVALYINGHNHNYERSQAIGNTTYLTCGAGSKTRRVGRSTWTARSASQLSFAALEVYSDRLHITGIDQNNRTFDRGSIPLISVIGEHSSSSSA
jgi:3',5'-cyclic AMP phosphodiesterase CpdA